MTYSNYTYTVTTIGKSAFNGCSNLQSVTLSNSVTTIGTSAFENCTGLQSVVIPSSVTAINTDAFYGCSKLGSVNLPEGLLTIGERAFWGCNLSSVTIPSTVTKIDDKAFQGNPLTSVTWLPVTCTIGTSTGAPFYSSNSQITSFVMGDKVQTPPAYLCYSMSKLESVVLPASVKSLGSHLFHNCTSLKSVNLPVAQKTLPASFFENCSSLESIELPATLTTISTDAFYGCAKLSGVTLHEGITTIGERAFWGCNLSSVTIPSTVTKIEDKAFQGNPLTSVTWLPAECTIGTSTGAPFYGSNSQITSFTFGDQVKIVPAYLCYNMSQLAEVNLPASVTNVYRNAFQYCSSLKSFAFPEGVVTVATSVLEGCTGLKKVIIPSSVTTINTDAFYNCSALQEIYNYAITPQAMEEQKVYNVNKHTCILYVPIDYMDLYQSKAVWCDFDNIIGVATGLHFEEQDVQVSYLKHDNSLYFMEMQSWQVPLAPRIDGFTFVKWQVLEGDLSDGVRLLAVYTQDTPTAAPAGEVVNPANPAQKLIRQGNVYILTDTKTYTMQGQAVQ